MSNFKKNFLKVLSGTASGQLISFILLPILSRTINPEVLGEYAISMMFVMILTPLICLKMDQALLASEDDNKDKIFHVGIRSSLLLSLLILFIVTIANISFFKISEVWIFLTVVSLISFTLSQLTVAYSLSIGNFGIAAKHRFARTVLTLVLQIFICHYYNDAMWMLLSYVVANVISMVLYNSLKSDLFNLRMTGDEIKEVLIEKKGFAVYQNISSLFTMSTQYIMNASMAYFASSNIIGHYSMTTRIMQSPITLISMSIKDAFYYKVKKIKNTNTIKSELMKMNMYLLVPAFTISLVVFLYIPDIFSYILGEQWFDSGIYAQILLPWYVARFINQPSMVVANIIGMQRFVMKFDILSFFINLISTIYFWILFQDVKVVLSAFCAINVILTMILMFLVYISCSRFSKNANAN